MTETTIDGMTFNEHVNAALAIAHDRRAYSKSIQQSKTAEVGSTDAAEHGAAARDLSISITALEDAATRYNSARYHQTGKWMRADPDRPS